MRTAIFSTYPPRACGIGTFAFDVRSSLLAIPGVQSVGTVAIVDEATSPQRHDVLATVSQAVRGDYVRAARLLGRLDVDVVLLQHEYGIFGGADGEYVLSFARELARPLVLTLHTVLSEPTDHQREVLTALCGEAERVIVMTETARTLLLRMNGCAPEKIRVVQHGAPAVLGRRGGNGSVSSRGLDRLRSRFVLSTFGLISPGKGIETAIAALPAIVDRHPEVLYLVAGRTHPEVARLEGEQYRLLLERRAVDLGVADHVEFDDRFLSVPELADLLHATDVFLTPYRNPEQIASGALTFALAAGCAAISTPYLFAKDMLATGAGTLVPFDDVGSRPPAGRGQLLRHNGACERDGYRCHRGCDQTPLHCSLLSQAMTSVIGRAVFIVPEPNSPAGAPASRIAVRETRVTDSPVAWICCPALCLPPARPARNIGMFSIE